MTWELPGVGKLISGIRTEILKIDGDVAVVHVQFPPGTPKDRSAAFAEAIRKEFPKPIRMVFTTPGVKIDVRRPKVINLNISNCVLTHKEAEKKISQVLKEEADTVTINIDKVRWKKPKKK
jgi:hypothetical protein